MNLSARNWFRRHDREEKPMTQTVESKPEGVVAAQPVANRPDAAIRLDRWVVVGFVWFVFGLFIDGWAHNNGRVDDSFFTPYHFVFYSGFLMVTLVHLVALVQGRRQGASWREALPKGYNLSLIGLVIFGLGGVSDMFWHELFGIEGSIDALISPTHLLLAIGMTLIITGPIRAAGHRLRRGEYPAAPLTVLLALAFFMLILAFMLQYAYFYVQYWAATGRTTGGIIGELQQVAGYTAILIDTVIIVGPMLLIMRRWRFPAGSFTLILVLNLFFMTVMKMDFLALPVALVAGIMTDGLYAALRPRPDRPGAWRGFAVGAAMLLPALFLAMLVWQRDVWWTVHVLFGLPVMAGLVGLMLSYLVLPPQSLQETL
jgi:hypothetical protein